MARFFRDFSHAEIIVMHAMFPGSGPNVRFPSPIISLDQLRAIGERYFFPLTAALDGEVLSIEEVYQELWGMPSAAFVIETALLNRG